MKYSAVRNWKYAFFKVETASNAAARLTGFFFIKKNQLALRYHCDVVLTQ